MLGFHEDIVVPCFSKKQWQLAYSVNLAEVGLPLRLTRLADHSPSSSCSVNAMLAVPQSRGRTARKGRYEAKYLDLVSQHKIPSVE